MARERARTPAPLSNSDELARLRALRRSITDRIEADIALLDAIEGDCDLEDDGSDEPSMGSHEGSQNGTDWRVAPSLPDECEVEDEGDELDRGEHDDADREPSLCGLTAGQLGPFVRAHGLYGIDTEGTTR